MTLISDMVLDVYRVAGNEKERPCFVAQWSLDCRIHNGRNETCLICLK